MCWDLDSEMENSSSVAVEEIKANKDGIIVEADNEQVETALIEETKVVSSNPVEKEKKLQQRTSFIFFLNFIV